MQDHDKQITGHQAGDVLKISLGWWEEQGQKEKGDSLWPSRISILAFCYAVSPNV